ncbi:SIS domain-containing protein [Hankyongella ginsenosidimutans]|uniref:SIS domain-containing protein n=1 Tax=Hankyongella ginsenosidimutans TaxID=1763828 RepID=A0A4D7C454_9SPHN|nr:SIS domain-containing protein [Hankyongella ginsenosidimutans]QCI79841.1 SIS domain-containing protein [Hankyongella ginsenosidimutans]
MSGPSPSLSALYPHMRPPGEARAEPVENLLHSVRAKARDHQDVFARCFAEQAEVLVAMAQALAASYRSGGRLLAMGNGGSSCDAAHVTVEFLHPVTAGRPALSAINLAADVAMMTAVGNDVGQEHIFVRPLIAHGRRGDCLVGFSTSGNSVNLLRAFAKAREMGIATLGFAGGDGGEMAIMGLDHLLTVPTSSIHRVQECHLAAYHILWDLTHTLLAADRRPLGKDGARP